MNKFYSRVEKPMLCRFGCHSQASRVSNLLLFLAPREETNCQIDRLGTKITWLTRDLVFFFLLLSPLSWWFLAPKLKSSPF